MLWVLSRENPFTPVCLADECLTFPSLQTAPASSVLEVRVDRAGDQPWTFLINRVMDQPVEKDDVVHVRFWARNIRSMTGSARMAAIVEQRERPHAKLMDLPVTVGSDWQCVDLPFIADRAYPAGEWQFNIRVGYAAQVLQIAGAEVRNYRKSIDIHSLPRMRLSYDGREPDAPWLKAALDRIEQIRKGNLTIQVKDPSGKPIPGAVVQAVLRKGFLGVYDIEVATPHGRTRQSATIQSGDNVVEIEVK